MEEVTISDYKILYLDETEKSVFKTAFELDQRRIIELAGDRTPYVCQAQSLNIFLKPDVSKRDLHMVHFSAWKRGVKAEKVGPHNAVGSPHGIPGGIPG